MSAAEAFERCIGVGGVAVFPADTVYGLACDPENRFAVERLYLLKRRPTNKPSAVMFFALEPALAVLADLGERTREAMRRLLPGGVTLLLPNPARRFPLACAEDPFTLGVRVVRVPQLEGVGRPVLQSSANRAGGPDARRIEEIPTLIRAAADLIVDGGALPGTPSTVVDLRNFEHTGEWQVVRDGAVPPAALEEALSRQFHFGPGTQAELFGRVAAALAPGGRFVLGDVVVPEDPHDARTPLTPGYDHPSPLADQLRWLREAGLNPKLTWAEADLAVVAASADIVERGGRRASV